MSEDVWFAFLVTFLAGSATGIGSVAALFSERAKPGIIAPALGFSAGVMVYVSFVEILPKSFENLSQINPSMGYVWATGLFFLGVLLAGLIDRCIPEGQANPHEPPADKALIKASHSQMQPQLLRTGLFSALVIALHNFPEGFATFISALEDPVLGIGIGVAIALHNIPEGIAVAVPIYFATGSKAKAVLISVLSGLAEPLGAVICYLVLNQFVHDTSLMLGISFGLIAGIMVFVALDELLPAAERYGQHHNVTYALFAGMALMAASLALFR